MCSTTIYFWGSQDFARLVKYNFTQQNKFICNTSNLRNNIFKYIVAHSIEYSINFTI